jgi:hypothetical protein
MYKRKTSKQAAHIFFYPRMASAPTTQPNKRRACSSTELQAAEFREMLCHWNNFFSHKNEETFTRLFGKDDGPHLYQKSKEYTTDMQFVLSLDAERLWRAHASFVRDAVVFLSGEPDIDSVATRFVNNTPADESDTSTTSPDETMPHKKRVPVNQRKRRGKGRR